MGPLEDELANADQAAYQAGEEESAGFGDADHRSFGLLGYAYLLDKKPLAAEGAYRRWLERVACGAPATP